MCSSEGSGSYIRCAEPGGVRGVVVLLRLRLALRSHPRPVVLDLAICRGVVPSQDGSDQTGHRRGRGEAAIPGLDRDPGATRQDVVKVQRSLVGGRVPGLRQQVVLGAGMG